jgi:hypothetical protein
MAVSWQLESRSATSGCEPGAIARDGQKENCGWEDFGIVQI